MRIFVAAELPQELYEALCQTSAQVRDAMDGRYVPPENFHVTLAFLGEVPSALVDDVAGAVEEACVVHAPFSTTLGGLGTFGRGRNVMLWQGFAQDDVAWQALAKDVRGHLTSAGFAIDAKRFLPHVTLMRRAQIPAGELPMPCVATDTVRHVTVFRSDLSGPAPRYEPLARFELVRELL